MQFQLSKGQSPDISIVIRFIFVNKSRVRFYITSLSSKMRHKKKQLTLPQKVFIVKTFYQCNDVEAVRKAIAKNFQVHSNSSIHPVIDKLVASFETSGSVNQSYSYEVSEEDVGKEDLKVQPGNQPEDVPEELPENEIVYDVFLVEEEAELNANGSDLPYDTIIEEEELLLPSSEAPDPSVEATKNNLQDKTNRSKDRRSKKHTCRYCQKEFCGRYLVPHYRKMHSDKAVYICSVCDEPFMAWEDYKEHKAQHIKQRCLKCPECDKVYPTMGTYNRHLKHHSGQRNHVCEWYVINGSAE